MRKMFSQKQIEEMNKEALTNGEVDIVGKTLQQKEANWEFDMPIDESYLEDNNLEIVSKYYKLVQFGNVLYFVCSLCVKNNGESSFSVNWDTLITNYEILVPEEIAKRIYDKTGHKVSENSGTADIARFPSFHGSSSGSSLLGHSSGANKLYVRGAGTTSISAGATNVFDARTFIILV